MRKFVTLDHITSLDIISIKVIHLKKNASIGSIHVTAKRKA